MEENQIINMRKIVLISCGNQKRKEKSKASDLYTGSLFVNSLNYAKKLNPDVICVLSALYYVLELDTEIEPYNVTLSNIPKSKRKSDLIILNSGQKMLWGQEVLIQLGQQFDLENDEFIILASKEYISPIESGIKNILNPLKDKNLFERQNFLKNN